MPDLLGPGLRLLLVGINPSMRTAATGLHFAHPGNRFYPALRGAGVLPEDVLTPAEATPVLRERGVGITNLALRPTVRADELTDDEVRGGPARIEQIVREHRPRVVAFLGITTYRLAFGRRKATVGRQPETIGDAEVWVLPNPSGLNAHATATSLAADYRAVAEAAGIV